MGVLPDHEIARLAADGMVTPFVATKHHDKGPSHGLSAAGYDCRLASTSGRRETVWEIR